MSLKSKIKMTALGALCWFGYPQQAEAKTSVMQSPTETVKDTAKLSVRDSIIQALENNRESNEKFARELSKPWQRTKVQSAVEAPKYDDPILERQLREGDLTMRDDYLYYRNLAETLLNFQAAVDDHRVPDESDKKVNMLRANQHATYIVQLRTGSARDEYLKKRLGVKLIENNQSLVAEYKKYGFEVGKDGKALNLAEIQNPSRVKDVQKRVKARKNILPTNYQAPARQF